MSVRMDYELARIRGFKRDLLAPELYERLIDTITVEDVVTILSETCYRDDITAALIDIPGYSGIERGLKTNLAHSFSEIFAFTSQDAKPLVRVLFGRFDLSNIKSILRGKHVGATVAEVMDAVLPAGELTEPLLARLAEQPDVKSVVNLLSSWFSPFAYPLRGALIKYSETGNLLDLELPLDVYFYQKSFEELNKYGTDMNALLLKEFLQMEIDFTNILTSLRLSKDVVSPDTAMEYFIQDGRKFGEDKYNQMVNAEEPEKILEVVAGTPYQKAIEDGLRKFASNGLVSSFQRALEEFMVRSANKLFLVDPLTIGVVIAYVWTKYNEVVNLRIIIRGKAVRMEENAIREALIVV